MILVELFTLTVEISFVLLILVELFTLTVETFFCFDDIGGTVYPHC
jgi:hypothetical protein